MENYFLCPPYTNICIITFFCFLTLTLHYLLENSSHYPPCSVIYSGELLSLPPPPLCSIQVLNALQCLLENQYHHPPSSVVSSGELNCPCSVVFSEVFVIPSSFLCILSASIGLDVSFLSHESTNYTTRQGKTIVRVITSDRKTACIINIYIVNNVTR